MFDIQKTDVYDRWFRKLRDVRAKYRIQARIRRIMESGHFGDAKGVGDNVSELRIDYGPGYWVYYTILDGIVVLLLAGGDKSSQDADVRKAIKLARDVKEQSHG